MKENNFFKRKNATINIEELKKKYEL